MAIGTPVNPAGDIDATQLTWIPGTDPMGQLALVSLMMYSATLMGAMSASRTGILPRSLLMVTDSLGRVTLAVFGSGLARR